MESAPAGCACANDVTGRTSTISAPAATRSATTVGWSPSRAGSSARTSGPRRFISPRRWKYGGWLPSDPRSSLHEGVLVGRPQELVGGELVADRGGGAHRRRRGGAERAATVGGPESGGGIERGEPVQRAVLRPGQLLGPFGRHEVDAGRRARDQGAAAEHADLARSVEQQEGQVLVGVTRGSDRAQGEPAEVDLLAVLEPAVRELPPTGSRGEHLGAVGGRELHGAGEEVGVEVGVGGVRDGQAPGLGGPAQRAEVAARVDGQGAAVAEVEEVRRVAEPGVRDDGEERITHGRPRLRQQPAVPRGMSAPRSW